MLAPICFVVSGPGEAGRIWRSGFSGSEVNSQAEPCAIASSRALRGTVRFWSAPALWRSLVLLNS
jgi:hypothetical protein